jgi:hypothetical protein
MMHRCYALHLLLRGLNNPAGSINDAYSPAWRAGEPTPEQAAELLEDVITSKPVLHDTIRKAPVTVEGMQEAAAAAAAALFLRGMFTVVPPHQLRPSSRAAAVSSTCSYPCNAADLPIFLVASMTNYEWRQGVPCCVSQHCAWHLKLMQALAVQLYTPYVLKRW